MIPRLWRLLFPPRLKVEPIPHPERLSFAGSITRYETRRD